MSNSAQKFTTFLMFAGQAEEAMNFYVSLFDKSRIISITRYAADEGGPEGTVMQARFSLQGQEFMCIDSPVTHDFTFTPAISLYVACENEGEITYAFKKLAESGMIMMPLAAYPFSKKFGWVQDRFGVSWQLNLGNE